MERKIEVVTPRKFSKTEVKRVCAYARVSCLKDEMLHSLSAQISYYQKYINGHVGWKYCGVYADEALTGTKDNRVKFQEMISECRKGNIDIIITKSISRFARNTVTLLTTIRELKVLGIDVYFEEQNIHSLSTDGELMLTILASYAQEESLSVSENQKWRVKMNFKEGKPWGIKMLGYRWTGKEMILVPQEAEIVVLIYKLYLQGNGMQAITNTLNASGYTGLFGKPWCQTAVKRVLTNYDYTGNLILQKTYRENHITKKTIKNNGELPKYHVEGSHEAIIPIEQFNEVQAEMERRKEKCINRASSSTRYDYSSLIVCEHCGKHFKRKITPYNVVWRCRTFDAIGKKACQSKQIPEESLLLALDGIDMSTVSSIIAKDNNVLNVVIKNGTEIERVWKDRSRANAWTEEKKEQARQRRLAQCQK